MTFFTSLEVLPPDPILGIGAIFRSDPRPEKINLSVGAYRDAEGRPFVLKSVREAEKKLLEGGINKEYLPIEGDSDYLRYVERLLFGKNRPADLFSTQTPGASGALAIGARLLAVLLDDKRIFFSKPTWPNHLQIFSAAGFTTHDYPYYRHPTNSFDREGFFAAFESMGKGTAFLIQGSCHNPCGIDLEEGDWHRLVKIVKEKKLLPFFDIAYQGFGADLDKDVAPVRLFAEEGVEMLVAYSFSKNVGLYGERTGMLSVVGKGEGIPSQVKHIIRTLYSSPPLHGALIVKTILGDAELEKRWVEELKIMRQRILEMREQLANALPELAFIRDQRGMFSYTGLSVAQVKRLKTEFGIYILEDGRINIAGLTQDNLHRVAEALRGVLSS